MERQEERMKGRYGERLPREIQVLRLDVVEETSRFCSWRLHVKLVAASVKLLTSERHPLRSRYHKNVNLKIIDDSAVQLKSCI